ncbi:MAG: GAF domain-containing protein [Thermodesulfobacteriota bacterium]|nr:MAG: GAF domain-containing protein [Thermodesulfobacteriota bacterium]
MESIIRCRKCGKKMRSVRVDDFKIKSYCSCGYLEYQTATAASKTINPHLSKESLLPLIFDEEGRFFFQADAAARERKEIITLEEVSMLASSDYDLDEVLKTVAEKTADRLGVDICSIYLWDGVQLVLRGTYGLAQEAVGKAKLKLGEGITGFALKERRPLLIEDVSSDKRYHYFSETREEQYKIRTMYSYPIYSGEDPFGALNAQTVVTKDFTEDELGFVAVVANLILGAVKMRKRPG